MLPRRWWGRGVAGHAMGTVKGDLRGPPLHPPYKEAPFEKSDSGGHFLKHLAFGAKPIPGPPAAPGGGVPRPTHAWVFRVKKSGPNSKMPDMCVVQTQNKCHEQILYIFKFLRVKPENIINLHGSGAPTF